MILHIRSAAVLVLAPLAAVGFCDARSSVAPPALRAQVAATSEVAVKPVASTTASTTVPPTPSMPNGTSAATGEPRASCPAGMVRAVGEHCTDAELKCLRWLDPPPYQNLRCAEFAAPATCRGKRTPMRFCIDQEEHGEAGSLLPRVNISFLEAKAVCAGEGKRLCREAEWEFACEGEEMRPYPYGFSRVSSTCNIDRTGLGGPNGKLRDLRAPNDAYPKCLSPFGVHNMTGNADEWVERDGPHRSVLRGGWWLPGRNRCRAATAEHGEGYADSQVGFRCCSDG